MQCVDYARLVYGIVNNIRYFEVPHFLLPILYFFV